MESPCIALYSGSFDPIHSGHINLARYISELPWVERVWISPSRRNPLKPSATIATDAQRLEMAEIAVAGIVGVDVTDVEMGLPTPSYTISTLEYLRSHTPVKRFKLIIGTDNWIGFRRWKEWERIIAEFGLIVYPRPGYPIDAENLPDNVTFLQEAPTTEISSTDIRDAIKSGIGSISPIMEDSLIHPDVRRYISEHHLYS
jgi:nicotinate-nucleotide adenylyltransferase